MAAPLSLALLLFVSTAAKPVPRAGQVGVGEISCSAEIPPSLCSELTAALVEELRKTSRDPVVRQSDRRQRPCGGAGKEAQAPCETKKRQRNYTRLVSGTVRPAGKGAVVSLRLLDGKRMSKEEESSAQAPSLEAAALRTAVREAAAPIAEKLK